MANLCVQLPVTVPPAPAPSRLCAGPLPSGRASRPPSQGGVGKGRGRGEEKEEVGGNGDPVVFCRGKGSTSEPSSPPPLYRQTHFLGAEATFLHLGQAETVAANWDSQLKHGPSGILSFSFFSFPRSLSPFSLPSPFFPPFIGVYLQSLQ